MFCEHTYKSNSFLVVLSLQVSEQEIPKWEPWKVFAWKIEQSSTNFMCFFSKVNINLQHTSCNLIGWLYIISYNHIYDIIYTYLQLMCYPTCKISPIKKKQNIRESVTPGILGSCHDAFPSLWRMVFNSGVGELPECGCLRTAWWWELGLLLRMGMVGQLMGWWWGWWGWWLVKLNSPKGGVKLFSGFFFGVGVQMSFWDGGEVVGLWFFWEKK